MRRSRIAALVLGVLLVVGKLASEAPAVNPDAARLQGTWEIVSVQRGGVAEAMHLGATVTFTADTVAFEASPIPVINIAELKPIDVERIARMAFS